MKQTLPIFFILLSFSVHSQALYKDSEIIFRPESLSQSFIPLNIDDDHLVDLVVAVRWGNNQRVVWKKNLGNGKFSSEKLISNSIHMPQYLASGDFDNDGFEDLVISASTKKYQHYLFKNNGDGSFTLLSTMVSENGQIVFLRDINDDGYDDLIFSAYGGDSKGYYLNDKKGNFAKKIFVLENVNKIVSVDLSDFDNDGDYDFVGVSNSPSKIFVVENIGDLKFSRPNYLEYSGMQPQTVKYADMDGDNYDDIVVTSSRRGGDVSIFKNDQFGAFNDQTKIGTIEWADRLTISDLDEDGDNDLVIGQTYGSAVILYNEGDLNFSEPDFSTYVVPNFENRYKNNYGAHTICVFDVDGDCDEDIITQEEGLFLFINQKQDNCDDDFSNSNSLEFNFSIYPNPTPDILYIDVINSKNYQASIFSMTGKLISSKNSPKKIDLVDVVSGTYIIQLKDLESRVSISAKFVVVERN